MVKAIVTGANGFIGKKLVEELANRKYDIVAIDIGFDDFLLNNPLITCIDMKGKEVSDLTTLIPKASYDCLYHLAWTGTSGPNRADYNMQLENVKMTCQYVELCKKVNCKKFLYASSINEMETYEYLQLDNVEPGGGYIYGTGKLAAHLMGETVAKTNGIGFIPVIITNIYGIGEVSARMIYTSLVKLERGEYCSFTEGHQMYDFIYITDAINSIVEVSEKGRPFNRYYIGSGEPKPLREFLIKMRDIVSPGTKLGLGDIPFKGVEISYDQFDLKKVEKDTGYTNKVSFEQGIEMTFNWIKKANKNDAKI